MKLILATALCLFALPVLASRTIPAKISCKSQALYAPVKSFLIVGLNTPQPRMTIPDTGFMYFENRDGVFSMGFSNECDNSYEVKISTWDLEQLSTGAVSEIKVQLDYSQSGYDDPTDGDDEISEKIEVTCRLLRL